MDAAGFKAGPRSQFWLMCRRVCIMAACVDVGLFMIFQHINSPILSWVNAAGVTMYTIAYQALKRRRNQLALTMIWMEVLTHTAMGTLMRGSVWLSLPRHSIAQPTAMSNAESRFGYQSAAV